LILTGQDQKLVIFILCQKVTEVNEATIASAHAIRDLLTLREPCAIADDRCGQSPNTSCLTKGKPTFPISKTEQQECAIVMNHVHALDTHSPLPASTSLLKKSGIFK
jgi:hypothetical protein